MKEAGKKLAAVSLALVVAGSAVAGPEAAAGYKFKYSGVTVTMDSAAKKLIKKAGKPIKKSVKKSCAYKGKDRTYQYKDFILKTYSKTDKGAEYVQGITFRTNGVSTKEGIKIGSDESAVKKKYGSQKPNFGIYTYIKGNTKLQFEISNKKVKNIRYVANKVK